jgi:hypothetical protein
MSVVAAEVLVENGVAGAHELRGNRVRGRVQSAAIEARVAQAERAKRRRAVHAASHEQCAQWGCLLGVAVLALLLEAAQQRPEKRAKAVRNRFRVRDGLRRCGEGDQSFTRRIQGMLRAGRTVSDGDLPIRAGT